MKTQDGVVALNKQGEASESLYAKRKKIIPRRVHGIFNRLRTLGVFILLGLFYGMAWVNWNGRQAVLFDLPERKFYIFNLVFWPQDFIYLTCLLIIAALSLFFFTALAGRLWCGYACPQTVWTETFLWMERLFEGSRDQQLRLQKMPWNREKILRKSGKQTAWILYALITGFTFVGYFTPIRELGFQLVHGEAGFWPTFWVFFYGFATYGNAGFLREQFCIYMCPYARFQSAMFDKDTLIISYDTKRGEPKGPRKHGVDPKTSGLGDCIDCKQCVQVCPTGIDIRDGLQYQCIACAACIDACDGVMEKMDYPKGLIRYTTENTLEGKKTHIFRPRIVIYGTVLLLLFSAAIYSLTIRVPLMVNVIRDRNTLFRPADNGLVENVYALKILNKDMKPHTYVVAVNGIPEARLLGNFPIHVEGGQIVELPVRVQTDPLKMQQPSSNIVFEVHALDNPDIAVHEKSRFVGRTP